MTEITVKLKLPTQADVERFLRTVLDEFPVKLEIETSPEKPPVTPPVYPPVTSEFAAKETKQEEKPEST